MWQFNTSTILFSLKFCLLTLAVTDWKLQDYKLLFYMNNGDKRDIHTKFDLNQQTMDDHP